MTAAPTNARSCHPSVFGSVCRTNVPLSIHCYCERTNLANAFAHSMSVVSEGTFGTKEAAHALVGARVGYPVALLVGVQSVSPARGVRREHHGPDQHVLSWRRLAQSSTSLVRSRSSHPPLLLSRRLVPTRFTYSTRTTCTTRTTRPTRSHEHPPRSASTSLPPLLFSLLRPRKSPDTRPTRAGTHLLMPHMIGRCVSATPPGGLLSHEDHCLYLPADTARAIGISTHEQATEAGLRGCQHAESDQRGAVTLFFDSEANSRRAALCVNDHEWVRDHDEDRRGALRALGGDGGGNSDDDKGGAPPPNCKARRSLLVEEEYVLFHPPA